MTPRRQIHAGFTRDTLTVYQAYPAVHRGFAD